LYEGPADQPIPEGIAPPHPDVEGRNPETGGAPAEDQASEAPPTVDAAEGDQNKEKSAKSEAGKPKPASEKQDATKKEL
jgi:dolichyl-phosphate-mannose-protein mannosyltransferase